MKLSQTISLSHNALLKAGIDHALIGGIALATLGLNRATQDLDLLIDGKDKEKAILTLKEVGFKLEKESKEV